MFMPGGPKPGGPMLGGGILPLGGKGGPPGGPIMPGNPPGGNGGRANVAKERYRSQEIYVNRFEHEDSRPPNPGGGPPNIGGPPKPGGGPPKC